jgi:ribosomal protein S18 acetylase RimI-like enzyme
MIGFENMIRPPVPADLSALSALARRVFVATYGTVIPPGIITRYLEQAFSTEKLSRDLNDAKTLMMLAWHKETLAGFCRLEPTPAPTLVQGDASVELCKLYVADEYHGQGVASQLMERSIGEAIKVGYEMMWLFVWEQNARAISFYRKHGFTTVGGHDIYIGEVLFRDFVMQRRL